MDMDMEMAMDTHDGAASDNPEMHPQIGICITNTETLDEEAYFTLMSQVPDPVRTGIKRRDSEDRRRKVETEPSEKLYCVDDAVAPALLDEGGYFMYTDTDKLTAEAERSAIDNQKNNLLAVPINFDPTQPASPKKKAVRRFSLSPQKLEFNKNGFDLLPSPRKKLEF